MNLNLNSPSLHDPPSFSIWSPTIQFTSRMYDPATNTNTFKSVNMTNFTLSDDRRSVKSDNMAITLDPTGTKYKVVLTHPELVVAIEFERVDRGFKIGEGKTYFGTESGAGTYVSHKFWPKARATGTFIVDNKSFEVEGDGMFIHALQGMQPHLIASKWNFVDFQAPDAALTMMQFQTTKQYGAVNVNQGSITLDGKLVSVSVENGVELLDLVEDEETQYQIPKTIKYTWTGKTVGEEVPQDVEVVMFVKTETLLDKIDVLNEVPYFLKKLVQTFVAKPYIYQWLDKATAEVTVGNKVITLEGKCFQELVFVSEM
ncbi:oxidative stress survival, Svf1-like protein [Jimgerdemannia flammicorona]|uniref:Oxidative stress survival, Svf1-like protein n=1 Tax=Jimgerdemannia flammicorona TaxID=994334 RepID=A0A433DJR7_9FUNG|nr:oxidative stress survival, Svf1-like protein [Jimgerdemannia flammicorona]